MVKFVSSGEVGKVWTGILLGVGLTTGYLAVNWVVNQVGSTAYGRARRGGANVIYNPTGRSYRGYSRAYNTMQNELQFSQWQ